MKPTAIVKDTTKVVAPHAVPALEAQVARHEDLIGRILDHMEELPLERLETLEHDIGADERRITTLKDRLSRSEASRMALKTHVRLMEDDMEARISALERRVGL
ncbi:hypothetical protein Tco_0507925 [Tanacetum coccineum]